MNEILVYRFYIIASYHLEKDVEDIRKSKVKCLHEITSNLNPFSITEMNMKLPILFIKRGCPWCVDAIGYFKKINLKFDVVDVSQYPERMKELIACSGQNKTPTMKFNSFVVADFDIGEFKQAML